jgi:aldose 1-epimerase
MALSISHKNDKGFDEIIISNKATDTSCAIIPAYGAALNSYKVKSREWIEGYENAAQMQKEPYRNVVLAPFPNRTDKATYSFEGKKYTLPVNREKEQNAIHGLLYNKVFEVIDEEVMEDEASVILSHYYEGDTPGYPFEFQINITYTLHEDNTLSVETIITHDNEGSIPFGLGFHPYFAIENGTLHFPECKILEAGSDLIPTGKTKPFEHSGKKADLKKLNLDTCLEINNPKKALFKLEENGSTLQISSEDFAYFQLYTPANKKSIAIEPMTCPANALNSGKGLLLLKPDKIYRFNWKIKG